MKRLRKITVLVLLIFANLSLWAQKADDYRLAAIGGDKEAQYQLGVCYNYGQDGVVKDCDQAIYWIKKSAEQGFAQAQLHLGCGCYYGNCMDQDYKQAVYWFKQAAKQGDVSAQWFLGECYYRGEGVGQDYKQAVYWYKQAAEQEDADGIIVVGDAQSSLGECYYKGEGVIQDYKQAVYWFTKAADNYDAWARMRLGECYYWGKGVNQDYKKAKYWANEALNTPLADENTKRLASSVISLVDNAEKGNTSNTGSVHNTSTSNKPIANTVETNLSKGEWRTSMRKVVDNVIEKNSNGVYKGQKSNNGDREGLGVYWWNDSGSYYYGEWTHGGMSGYGVFVSGEGKTLNNCPNCAFYVGNWKDGKKSGEGTCYDRYGNLIYYGDFSNDRPTGTYPTTGSYSSYKFECIKYESNNSVYIGETKNGKRHGYGIYIWKNWYNNAWYGHWEDDNRSGYGIDLFYDGNIKYGKWIGDEYYNVSNKQTDNTVETNLSKGEWRTSMRKVVNNVTKKNSNGVYKGQTSYNYFRGETSSTGKEEGMGVYWWNEGGSYYLGEWAHGDKNGYGIYICGEGRVVNNCSECLFYVGNWKDNKKTGKGTCYDRYGNLIYYGDFSNDRPIGTYPTTGSYSSNKFECIKYDNKDSNNRDVYIGETKDGKRHGYGILIWKNGDAWYGHWEDGARAGFGIELNYMGYIKYGKWIADVYYYK